MGLAKELHEVTEAALIARRALIDVRDLLDHVFDSPNPHGLGEKIDDALEALRKKDILTEIEREVIAEMVKEQDQEDADADATDPDDLYDLDNDQCC